MTLKTAVAAARPAAWTVRPGDTLSGIAAALGVAGGWQALYAANRQAVGRDPDLIRAGTILAVPGTGATARYTVAPGDTLSGIAAALCVAGGWRALYAANRRAIGQDPNVIHAGLVLAPTLPVARTATSSPGARGPAHRPTAITPAGGTALPGGSATPARGTAPAARAAGGGSAFTGGMPRWLEDVLVTVGLLAASAFAAEPAAAFVRRRKAGRARRTAVSRARIICADHDRLIVTYCAREHTVYVLTPPGEDPRAVLLAARLVLPEQTYRQLAGHLGVPSAWPRE
jgi:hypothetical protein